MSQLTISGLRVARSGRPIVRDVDLDVRPGEVTALIGPNGAGKSTLVLAVTGLLPAAGSIRLGDTELVGRRPDQIRRAGLAAVPEGHRVLTDLSVRDNITAATTRSATDRALARAFETFPELEPLADQRAGSLSGGQQQMLAFSQALVGDPDVIVIDEMSLGLAPVIVERLTEVVASISTAGVGVLLIEQYTTVALALADSASVMFRGEITFTGPAQKLVDDPDLLHQAYFGESEATTTR